MKRFFEIYLENIRDSLATILKSFNIKFKVNTYAILAIIFSFLTLALGTGATVASIVFVGGGFGVILAVASALFISFLGSIAIDSLTKYYKEKRENESTAGK